VVGLIDNHFLCFVQKLNQKLFLIKSEALKNKIIYFFILRGFFRGLPPPTEIWARKAESLKNRVGGL